MDIELKLILILAFALVFFVFLFILFMKLMNKIRASKLELEELRKPYLLPEDFIVKALPGEQDSGNEPPLSEKPLS